MCSEKFCIDDVLSFKIILSLMIGWGGGGERRAISLKQFVNTALVQHNETIITLGDLLGTAKQAAAGKYAHIYRYD